MQAIQRRLSKVYQMTFWCLPSIFGWYDLVHSGKMLMTADGVTENRCQRGISTVTDMVLKYYCSDASTLDVFRVTKSQ